MELATYRKKAREIESQLLNKLAERGQGELAKVLGLDDPLRNVARLRYCKRKSVQNIGSSLIYYCSISPKEARNRMEWAMDILEGEMFYAIKREMEKEILKIAA